MHWEGNKTNAIRLWSMPSWQRSRRSKCNAKRNPVPVETASVEKRGCPKQSNLYEHWLLCRSPPTCLLNRRNSYSSWYIKKLSFHVIIPRSPTDFVSTVFCYSPVTKTLLLNTNTDNYKIQFSTVITTKSVVRIETPVIV